MTSSGEEVPSRIPDILTHVATYYSDKLAEHGETARGVDWNGEESQVFRFEQLCKIIEQPSAFSLNDLGCGYGALYDYLSSRYLNYFYYGYDVSPGMIRAAQDRYPGKPDVTFTAAAKPLVTADYGVASGIFNVKLGHSEAQWREHLQNTLDILDHTSKRGFAFNCLTSYSDKDKTRDYLYYADPCALFDHCKRRYSRHVSLLHDYGLYEFTILVRKFL
jgi:SAM-dependent methyltransferase